MPADVILFDRKWKKGLPPKLVDALALAIQPPTEDEMRECERMLWTKLATDIENACATIGPGRAKRLTETVLKTVLLKRGIAIRVDCQGE